MSAYTFHCVSLRTHATERQTRRTVPLDQPVIVLSVVTAGGTLREIPLDEPAALRLLEQTASAVRRLHEQGGAA